MPQHQRVVIVLDKQGNVNLMSPEDARNALGRDITDEDIVPGALEGDDATPGDPGINLPDQYGDPDYIRAAAEMGDVEPSTLTPPGPKEEPTRLFGPGGMGEPIRDFIPDWLLPPMPEQGERPDDASVTADVSDALSGRGVPSGIEGVVPDDRYREFDTYEEGRAAQRDLWKTPGYQDLPVREAIDKWSPQAEEGHINEMLAAANALNGVKMMRDVTDDELDAFMNVQEKWEGWLPPDAANPQGSRSFRRNNPGNITRGGIGEPQQRPPITDDTDPARALRGVTEIQSLADQLQSDPFGRPSYGEDPSMMESFRGLTGQGQDRDNYLDAANQLAGAPPQTDATGTGEHLLNLITGGPGERARMGRQATQGVRDLFEMAPIIASIVAPESLTVNPAVSGLSNLGQQLFSGEDVSAKEVLANTGLGLLDAGLGRATSGMGRSIEETGRRAKGAGMNIPAGQESEVRRVLEQDQRRFPRREVSRTRTARRPSRPQDPVGLQRDIGGWMNQRRLGAPRVTGGGIDEGAFRMHQIQQAAGDEIGEILSRSTAVIHPEQIADDAFEILRTSKFGEQALSDADLVAARQKLDLWQLETKNTVAVEAPTQLGDDAAFDRIYGIGEDVSPQRVSRPLSLEEVQKQKVNTQQVLDQKMADNATLTPSDQVDRALISAMRKRISDLAPGYAEANQTYELNKVMGGVIDRSRRGSGSMSAQAGSQRPGAAAIAVGRMEPVKRGVGQVLHETGRGLQSGVVQGATRMGLEGPEWVEDDEGAVFPRRRRLDLTHPYAETVERGMDQSLAELEHLRDLLTRPLPQP